ncbi:hypothetical protein MKK88_22935 [Methylobacterium sp. E-005]|uniref:hypothetical protein n=1 Tax=Methylobacterium sp. E-005 TaxID=2836549 RepID=UPI001FB99E41|nr:hypothetical protein [Methylobacterium sp. E-005]MCJ2088815.1 hypothetical protein [Methylobacterium sp. E-005]
MPDLAATVHDTNSDALGRLSNPPPHPEVPQRSEGLEGALQMDLRSLEPFFEARFAVTSG